MGQMGVGMRLERGGRRAIRVMVGASLVIGMAAGCRDAASTGDSSPTTAATAISTASASGRPAPTASKTRPTATRSAAAPIQVVATTPPAPATSAPAADPTTPAQAPSQAPAGGAAFVASCPAHGSTSASGCGSWDAGASSGQAPGFAAGQQSSPNLLGVNQDPWTGGQGPQVLTASSFQDWSVTATDTDPSNASGEVLTYRTRASTTTRSTRLLLVTMLPQRSTT